jgi:60 kDa SS-A/Ro ribonucleoprotein
MYHYAKNASPTRIPQTEPLPGQIANAGGGYSYPVDDWKRLERFLVLGSEGGSYYVSADKLTRDNTTTVARCLAADGERVVRTLVEISDAGRAPKNDPALFVLALAMKTGDGPTRRAAQAALPKVARIGTHLFHLASFVNELGGWGRGTRRAFSNWYTDADVAGLAYDVIKYQSRDGWSHRDLLRLCHVAAPSTVHADIYNWITKGWESVGEEPHPDEVLRRIWAFERAKIVADRKQLIKLVAEHGLPHECVPNEWKQDPAVWEAMLPNMGITALVRNLGKMTSVSVLRPLGASAKHVVAQLTDVERLRKARVHPLSLLLALRTYKQGHGDKGKLSWNPVPAIIDALDASFYLAFKAVAPTNKRYVLALDVSASMTWKDCAGMPITPREASSAMALTTANVESDHHICAFSDNFIRTTISPRQRLDDVTNYVDSLEASYTDCSAPMTWAISNKIPVDVFVVYTDSETNAGNSPHAAEALRQYRQKSGIAAKLVVCAMVANPVSIADPNDGGMLDVVGFDTATPAVLADFAR